MEQELGRRFRHWLAAANSQISEANAVRAGLALLHGIGRRRVMLSLGRALVALVRCAAARARAKITAEHRSFSQVCGLVQRRRKSNVHCIFFSSFFFMVCLTSALIGGCVFLLLLLLLLTIKTID